MGKNNVPMIHPKTTLVREKRLHDQPKACVKMKALRGQDKDSLPSGSHDLAIVWLQIQEHFFQEVSSTEEHKSTFALINFPKNNKVKGAHSG